MDEVVGYKTSEQCAACNPGVMIAVVVEGELVHLTNDHVQGQCNNCNDRAGVSLSHVEMDNPVTQPVAT